MVRNIFIYIAWWMFHSGECKKLSNWERQPVNRLKARPNGNNYVLHFLSFFFIFFHFSSFSFNFHHFLSFFFHFKTCPHFLQTFYILTFVFIFCCYIHFNMKRWIWMPYTSQTGLNVDRFDFVIKRVPHPP